MYRLPLAFHALLQAGQVPVPYVLIHTALGWRAFAEKELSAFFDVEANLADGSVTADGSETAGSGSLGLLEKSGRLLRTDGLDRTIQPKRRDILASYTSRQQQRVTVTLDNADHHVSKLIAQEPFMGRQIRMYLGFESLPFSTHLPRFDGTVNEIELTGETTRISGIES